MAFACQRDNDRTFNVAWRLSNSEFAPTVLFAGLDCGNGGSCRGEPLGQRSARSRRGWKVKANSEGVLHPSYECDGPVADPVPVSRRPADAAYTAGMNFLLLENHKVLLDLHRSEHSNRQMAHHDLLTSLPNRAMNQKLFADLPAGHGPDAASLRSKLVMFCLDLVGRPSTMDSDMRRVMLFSSRWPSACAPASRRRLRGLRPRLTTAWECRLSRGIKVKAIGINRAEAMWRVDDYVEPVSRFPAGIGYEAAGFVDAVAKDVKGFKVGD